MDINDITIKGTTELLTKYEASKKNTADVAPNLLKDVFDRALTSLGSKFGAKTAELGAAGLKAPEYAKMFTAVAENFSTLFAELNKMRSSYLPFELVKEIPTVDGAKTLEEIVDTESVLESYENVFFRMLGMPSTTDLEDNGYLIKVKENGTLVDTDSKINKAKYMSILNLRQTSRSQRPGAPTNSLYDFVSGSQSALAALTDKGWESESISDLTQFFSYIKSLNSAEKLDTSIIDTLSGFINDKGGKKSLVSLGPEGKTYYDVAVEHLESYKLAFKDEETEAVEGEEAVEPVAGAQGAALASPEEARRSLFWAMEAGLSNIRPDITLEQSELNALWNEFVAEEQDVTLMSLNKPEVFWQFSYLLFPPVQDGRVAKCINEPSKMIAEPFTPSFLRTINGHKMKSTLLEAVIRIRMDMISGTALANSNPAEGSVRVPVTVGNFPQPVSQKEIIEKMGLIESLIIIRLFSALQGFAMDIQSRLADLISLQHQSGNTPGGEMGEDNAASPVEKRKFCETNDERCTLETMKLIEDSMLLILGDGEVPEVLDLQVGVARNSGVKNAHLMSAVLSIMDVPRRWVEKGLAEIDEYEANIAERTAGTAVSQISSKLGISKGVGGIDILAFLIALFTMKENHLLCLLTDEQFENLKEEYPDNFFSDFTAEKDMHEAVNQVALRAYDAYQLFRYALSYTGSTFVNPAPSSE